MIMSAIFQVFIVETDHHDNIYGNWYVIYINKVLG
jgi:hypothetical protein